MEIPRVARLRQVLDQPVVHDVAGTVRRALAGSKLRSRLKPGGSVALAVGSRGIANLVTMVEAALRDVEAMGFRPFVVAAMGSHGGATPDGQRQLLADYGVTEERLRVPVKTDMDVVELGRNSMDFPVYWDRNAFGADAVVTISRIKPHTDFRGRFESGILKMLVIGLGKREGPSAVHQMGVRGLREVMPESAKVILEKTKFACGLAVLENAAEQTAKIKVVEREELFDVEPRLLDEARELMGRLPFDELDVLVIGEMGKNYSGAGIDPNVIGRLYIVGQPEPDKPRINRIVVLDLSPESHGNAAGIGLADFTTDRLVTAIERGPFLTNSIVSTFVERSKIPLAFPTDREAIQAAVDTCWQVDPARLRLAVVPNTLELTELWVSPALADRKGMPAHLHVEDSPRPLPFDDDGNLVQKQLFPHSVGGRRSVLYDRR
ncbi:MAG: DUF2088 domain-containing protein [Planctomycetes bacterium]|nr:DUF2088 domain-containing protein [Planctomycetota bacterium]